MQIQFTKYQGTGNDFIIVDNRDGKFPKDDLALIARLTDRKFGIGADGLMLIESSDDSDFNMFFFNPDGSQSLCGNGSRCAVDFARTLDLLKQKTKFTTTDGHHLAHHDGELIQVEIHDVDKVEFGDDFFFIDNGSPHHIVFVDNVDTMDVSEEGAKIRNSRMYSPSGTNVNFVEVMPNSTIRVRTYERGVEAETLSCGTGVVASALSASIKGLESPIHIETLGGKLSVSFDRYEETKFTNIFLSGPAKRVFEGEIEI